MEVSLFYSAMFCPNLDDLLQIYLLNRRTQFKIVRYSFNFHKLSTADCKLLFRFEKHDVLRLQRALNIPQILTCINGTKFLGLEGLCILLRRFAYPNRLTDLVKTFSRSKSELSLIVSTMSDLIYENFSYLLTDLNLWWLGEENLQIYSRSIEEKGCALDNCWGFVDGTIRPCCRPKRHQRELFSGHKRVHGLKFQSVVIPNGLIAHLYGPVPGRRHDSFMLTDSNLLPLINTNIPRNNRQYVIYGDPAYPIRSQLICPFKGAQLTDDQRQFNKSMSVGRISVEWEFGKIATLFAFLDFKKNTKLFLQPIAKYYIIGALLKNCHTCIYGSQTSRYFNVNPPNLENYLSNEPGN